MNDDNVVKIAIECGMTVNDTDSTITGRPKQLREFAFRVREIINNTHPTYDTNPTMAELYKDMSTGCVVCTRCNCCIRCGDCSC
jgi:hypothetical protein